MQLHVRVLAAEHELRCLPPKENKLHQGFPYATPEAIKKRYRQGFGYVLHSDRARCKREACKRIDSVCDHPDTVS